METRIRQYLSEIGRLGGTSRSKKKLRAAQQNLKRARRALLRFDHPVLRGVCPCGCGKKTAQATGRPPRRRWTTSRKGYEVCSVTGCWIPHRRPDARGYTFSTGSHGHTMLHRKVWSIWFGAATASSVLFHLCGTPECVNPFHLEPVSRGESSRRITTKLSERDVDVIRSMAAAGESDEVISKKFGITQTYCRALVAGRARNAAAAEKSESARMESSFIPSVLRKLDMHSEDPS